MPKKLYAFRLPDEVAGRIVELAKEWKCSQGEVVGKCVLAFAVNINEGERDFKRAENAQPLPELRPKGLAAVMEEAGSLQFIPSGSDPVESVMGLPPKPAGWSRVAPKVQNWRRGPRQKADKTR